VKYNKSIVKIDNKSYINDFELLQKNSNNITSVKITSPKAIIDIKNNDIKIFKSSIEIFNKNGQDFQVKSDNSIFNNFSNVISVFNNVKFSFFENEDYYITTNSIKWDLNTSIIDINNPIKLNFMDTTINASNGNYNIVDSLLKIDNSEFKRNIYNSESDKGYQVEIKSDIAKWYKNDNTLEFLSDDKQVETTLKFLTIE
tara:strand:+ start:548 stop:1147 length:600 start_codon:yes stop_codon:yes gene_type:complete